MTFKKKKSDIKSDNSNGLLSALRSGENRTTMHKCYTFLIFMVLLLPSLGLSR